MITSYRYAHSRAPLLLAAALTAACAPAPAPVPSAAPARPAAASAPPPPPAVAPDSITAERNRYAAEALVLVKGRETAPVESVFKNLKVLRGFPAGRLIPVMNLGWGRALGVSCTHCHVPGNWASDEKPAKDIARDMVRMGGTIAATLSNIQGLKDRKPIVNCTTCHRGMLKPALNLP